MKKIVLNNFLQPNETYYCNFYAFFMGNQPFYDSFSSSAQKFFKKIYFVPIWYYLYEGFILGHTFTDFKSLICGNRKQIYEISIFIIIITNEQKMDKAIFGGGCFWCVQALLKNLKGVQKVMPGYCGGRQANPKYLDVKTGTTGHIEVVQITYEPNQITFQQLLEVFMNIHDPTQSNGQGEDIGSQYLSSIFCQNESQLQISQKVIEKLGQQLKNQGKKIYTLIFNALPFYEAQEYHQNYYQIRGKENPYCDIIPGKIAKMKHLFKQICHE